MAAHETGLKVRRAAAADTDEMLRVIGQAFGTPERPFWDCRRELPYLFHEGRIGDHFVCEDAGRIVGVIGLYPYDFRYESVIFRSAGVGQVGTLPEYRGRGVMSAILREVCRAIYEDGIDFAWLGGDRLRYGRYGWARGGFSLRFDLSDRYLPPPPPDGAVRPLDAARDFDMVRAAVYGAGSGILMPDAELRMRLSGPGMGWVMGGSFVVSHYKREDTIVLADGNAAEIATLLSHHLAHLRKSNAALSRVVAMVGPHPTPLMRACYEHHGGSSVSPPWMFRAGCLVPLLEKLCRVAAPRLGGGSDRIGIVNPDTGESATIVCEKGRATVEPGAGTQAVRLATRELSELCFGLFPPDMFVPGLAPDSPVRRILPAPLFISSFFAL